MSATLDKKAWQSVLRDGYTPPTVSPDDDPVIAAIAASQSFQDHLLASSAVRSFLEGLPRGSGGILPDSPLEELVRYTCIQRAQVDKSNPLLTLDFLRTIVFPAVWCERATVLDALNQCTTLTPDERLVIENSYRLAQISDDLWMEWFARIATPYQQIAPAERETVGKRLRETLPQFDYTAYNLNGGDVLDRSTWANAWPHLSPAVITLVCDQFQSPELGAYFRALVQALICTDVDLLEQRWAAVDEAFLALPPTLRFLPVHGIESGYEHPVGVSPEFRLHARTDYYATEIGQIRSAVERYAGILYDDRDRVEAYRQRLARTDIAVFGDIIRSGVSVNFRLAGQSLPNRPEVAHRYGGRIILDRASGEMMYGVYQNAVRQHCTPEAAAWLAPFVTADSMLEHTTFHEFSHPLWRSSEGDAALGDAKDLLEEAKASQFGLAAILHEGPSPDHLHALLAHSVARTVRFFTKTALGNPTAAPYVRENAAATTILIDAGILRLTSDGIAVDPQDVKPDRWLQESQRFLLPLVQCYAATDREGIASLTNQYCDLTAGTALGDLVAWVNR